MLPVHRYVCIVNANVMNTFVLSLLNREVPGPGSIGLILWFNVIDGRFRCVCKPETGIGRHLTWQKPNLHSYFDYKPQNHRARTMNHRTTTMLFIIYTYVHIRMLHTNTSVHQEPVETTTMLVSYLY